MAARRKYDWDKLRTLFIEGYPVEDKNNPHGRVWVTQKELADRENVRYDAVRERASMENWTDSRVAYQVSLEKKRQALRGKELAKEAVDFDATQLRVAKMGTTLVTARMAQIFAEHQVRQEKTKDALERMKQGLPVQRDELWSAVNYKELDGLSRAAETFQRLGRTALGEDILSIRHEHSGELEIDQVIDVTVSEKLKQDDADRIGRLIAAMEDAGLMQVAEDIMDADVVYDEDEEDDTKQIGA